jgi:hypothetical protein
MAEQQAERFVVNHTLVENWPRGTVISRDQLRTRKQDDPDTVLHDAHDRLLALGAIRPAREGEEGLARVPVPEAGLSAEATLRLGQMDAEIEQLTRNLGALRERLAFHERANPAALAAPEEDPAVAAAMDERQARLDGLKAQFDAMHARLAEMQGQTARGDEARARAASDARGGREVATGQAPPLQAPGQEDPAAQARQPQPQPPPEEPQRRRGRARAEGEGGE